MAWGNDVLPKGGDLPSTAIPRLGVPSFNWMSQVQYASIFVVHLVANRCANVFKKNILFGNLGERLQGSE
jgi:hypothetical protein